MIGRRRGKLSGLGPRLDGGLGATALGDRVDEVLEVFTQFDEQNAIEAERAVVRLDTRDPDPRELAVVAEKDL